MSITNATGSAARKIHLSAIHEALKDPGQKGIRRPLRTMIDLEVRALKQQEALLRQYKKFTTRGKNQDPHWIPEPDLADAMFKNAATIEKLVAAIAKRDAEEQELLTTLTEEQLDRVQAQNMLRIASQLPRERQHALVAAICGVNVADAWLRSVEMKLVSDDEDDE